MAPNRTNTNNTYNSKNKDWEKNNGRGKGANNRNYNNSHDRRDDRRDNSRSGTWNEKDNKRGQSGGKGGGKYSGIGIACVICSIYLIVWSALEYWYRDQKGGDYAKWRKGNERIIWFPTLLAGIFPLIASVQSFSAAGKIKKGQSLSNGSNTSVRLIALFWIIFNGMAGVLASIYMWIVPLSGMFLGLSGKWMTGIWVFVDILSMGLAIAWWVIHKRGKIDAQAKEQQAQYDSEDDA